MSTVVPAQVKQALGKHLKEAVLAQWVEEEKEALRRERNDSHANPSGEQLVISCYQRFLFSDLRYSCAQTIGFEISSRAEGTLEGKHVIQINEKFNCASAAKFRFEDSGRNRCLKMHCTDGLQDFVAVELQFLPSLSSGAAAGTKVLVKDAPVRRGALLLSPACAAVLGGEVEPLENANKRKIGSWNQVVRGDLGIKKEQHVDSIEKLHDLTTREALGIPKRDRDGREKTAAATTTTEPAGPGLDENRNNTHPTRNNNHKTAEPPLPSQRRITTGQNQKNSSSEVRMTSNDRYTQERRRERGEPPPPSPGPGSQMQKGRHPSGPEEEEEEEEEDPFRLSEPQAVLGGGSGNVSGVLPSLSPLSENNMIPTTTTSPLSGRSRESPSFQQSYRLPVWAEAAANEMAENGADDLEMKENNQSRRGRHSCAFVDSQAKAGAAGEQSTLELTKETNNEDYHGDDGYGDDANDPVQDLQVDVDLVSNSESSSFHEDINVQDTYTNCAGYMNTNTDTNFIHLANIGNLQPFHRVIVYNCTIHDVMSLSVSDGKYRLRVSIEDGTDICEVSLCHEVVEKHFGITPAELKGLSLSEKQKSQRNLEKHFALWQGYMELEKDASSGALIALSMEQPNIDIIRAAVNWLGS